MGLSDHKLLKVNIPEQFPTNQKLFVHMTE